MWAVQWSVTSEWVVITGGCDGAIRLWDVRRAGCFSILDHNKSWQVEKQHKVTSGRRTAGPPGVTPQRVKQVGDHLGLEHCKQSFWLSTLSMSSHEYILGNGLGRAFVLLSPVCQALRTLSRPEIAMALLMPG